MWAVALRKRVPPANTQVSEARVSDADRVRQRLVELHCEHLFARAYGQHILIEPRPVDRPRDRDAIARLTALGPDAYGLAFRKKSGGWEPVVLIDTLYDIVANMTAALLPQAIDASDAA
jgi:hypothetical protein